MGEIKKSVLGSVRLDSDVWEAVRGMPVSLNVFLRESLLGRVRPTWDKQTLGEAEYTPEVEKRIAEQVKPRRLLRDETGPHDLIPPKDSGLKGTFTVDAEEKSVTMNVLPLEAERQFKAPILRPKDRKK